VAGSEDADAPSRIVNRGAIHQALREAHGRASPGATAVIVDALERIAAQLVSHSGKQAQAERRRTILARHARDAFADFLWPRQGIGRATKALRDALTDLEALLRTTPSELPVSSARGSADDDEDDV
jgi:histone H3/H4